MYYIYNNETNVYLREEQGQPSPLEKGIFLQPPFSTTIEPPIADDVAVYENGNWVIKIDNSSLNYWLKSDASKVIFNLGDDVELVLMTELEPLVYDPEWDSVNSIWIESQASLDAKALQAKLEALATITVTTTNGNTFDGDDVARADMVSAVTSADTLGQTTTSWKLADNSWVTVDVVEMREALALAIQAKGTILAG